MKEIWKDIEGYDGDYQISNFGVVKSFKKCRGTNIRILKSKIDRDGYLNVCLHKNKKVKTLHIHRLVWDAFGDSPRKGRTLQIDHIDNNKNNNRIDNLQLLSSRENITKVKLYYNKSSKYTGVTWDKSRNKWLSRIKINEKHIHLGRYNTEEEASAAYQSALIKIKEGA